MMEELWSQRDNFGSQSENGSEKMVICYGTSHVSEILEQRLSVTASLHWSSVM